MQHITRTVLTLTLFVFSGLISCAPKPPGPAERLGRTIDQLSNDISEISQDMDEKERAAQEKIKVNRRAPSRDESWKTRPYDEY